MHLQPTPTATTSKPGPASRIRIAALAAAILLGLVPAAASAHGSAAPTANQGAAAAAPSGETFEGIVRTLAADTIDPNAPAGVFTGHSHDVYRQVLVTGSKTYFLKGRRARNNTRVRLTGQRSGNEIEATSVETLATVEGLPATGTTRVLVMLAHWGGPDARTPEQVAAQMFSDSDGWYRDASYSGLGQTGDVTPWMQIPAPAQGCYANSGTLMSDARAKAAQLGYDLGSYDNFVLYFPNCAGDAAGYAGWAYVGAGGTWLNGYMDRRVTVHEEGHNYGLWHSHSNMCSGGGLDGTCTFSDYGDPFDAMGSSGYVGHFNAAQKTLLGWMGGRTVDLSAGGSATLAPMAGRSSSPRAAVVNGADGRRYWLEYRQPQGFDSNLPIYGTEGVLVHVTGPGTGSWDSGSSLIDVRPEDGISQNTSALRSGQSWTSAEGLRFSVGSVSASGAAVTVGPAGTSVNDATVGTTAGTFSYAGTWKTSTGTAKYLGDDHYSNTTNSSYTFRFSGTQVALYGAKASHHGQASVQIDGGTAVTVDQYAATRQENVLMFRSAALAAGAHTVKVTVKGTRQAASSGTVIAVDRAEYVAAPLTTVNDAVTGATTNTFAYAGTWQTSTGAAKYQGDDHYSYTTGSSYTFRFSGTQVALYGAKASHHGQASVQIDGGTAVTVDQYSSTRQDNVLMYRSPALTAGAHTVRVTVKGTRQAASTGTVIAVDRAEVSG